MTENWHSSTAMISVHSSAMTLTEAFWCLFKIDPLTHVPSPLIRSLPLKVYTAFLEAFSMKTCNSPAPQDMTKSTNLVKLVEWAIWCRVRKWVQHTKDFIAALFFSLSYIPTLCSCCTTQPCLIWLTGLYWLEGGGYFFHELSFSQ